jgi:hypothetical protein
VERAALEAAGEFFIGTPGLLKREIFGDGDEGVEPRLGFPDAAKRFPGEFNGRDRACAKLRGRFVDGHGLKTGAGSSFGLSCSASRWSSSRIGSGITH